MKVVACSETKLIVFIGFDEVNEGGRVEGHKSYKIQQIYVKILPIKVMRHFKLKQAPAKNEIGLKDFFK